jgi:hypothetical protein
MKRLFVPQTSVAGLAAKACCALFISVVLTVMGGGALFAQTTSSVNPSPVPAEPAVKQDDDPPPGGCMPIGVTASGEIVFPLQCAGFIERQHRIAVQEKPAITDEKRPAAEEKPGAAAENPPAAEEKPLTKQSEAAVPETGKPADNPVKAAPLQKRAEQEPHERPVGPPGCTHFRSYDPVSGTYRTYNGRRLSCR